jgi:hypothetical protein
MLVNIYRCADRTDCSNGGISSKVSRAVLTSPMLPEIFEPTAEAPEFQLVKKNYGRDYFCAYPVINGEMRQGLFGGNYLSTSDSRLDEITQYPIPIHDRFETAEEYKL